MSKSNSQDYVPFGEEWKAEMKKWKKDLLIEFLRKNTMQRNELLEALKLIQKRLESLINATPTGGLRNQLIQEHINALVAIANATGE